MSILKIYHGSLDVVSSPEIRSSNRTLNYGCGFYTTTSLEQAQSWVKRHSHDKSKPQCGYVNVYEIDLELVKDGNSLWFDTPSEEWVDFVYSNRNDPNFKHSYDFVYGPVADDKVYAAFALYESGLFGKKDLIRELKTYKLVDQLLFHTEHSLEYLTFVEAKSILL